MTWRTLLRPLRRTTVGAAIADSRLRPRSWKSSLDAARLLWFQYGHLRSVQTSESVDATGEPVPWFTYPAIEYLKQLDLSDRTVFEYGAGNSTLFWSRRAARVISVEDEEEWYERVRRKIPANCTLLHESDLRRYVDAIDSHGKEFDIVIVDGPGRAFTRMKCARAALRRLKHGGLIILDNSDWVPDTARLLRDSDLLQVDMSGFTPIARHTQTTSFFFHRECRLRPRSDVQPEPSLGGVIKNWDREVPQPGRSVRWEDHTFYGVCHEEEFTKATTSRVRRFRLLVYAPGPARRSIAIFDCDLDRILMVGRWWQLSPDVGRELQAIRDMDWPSFREFVRKHPYRFYVPD